ncbi:MAG TPA: cytochrome P450 [Acidimicrobiales bacterium]|nr:cytochrome P450 [Acidimicrobiales bacterium]
MTDVLHPSDWATDFDILDPDYVRDPSARWQEQRERCPIAHTNRRGSTWLPVTYDDIAAIAHDVEHFSSRDIAVITPGREHNKEAAIMLEAPPITSDPPVHTWARRLLLPAFGPSAIEKQTPITQALANELIDAFLERGEADLATEYAQHIPVRVIAQMIGVPTSDEAMFTRWAVEILQEGFGEMEKAMGAVMELINYFTAHTTARKAMSPDERPDDLLTLLCNTEIDGEPLSDRHLIGTCFLLLLAGIDTTWSSIGSSLFHLASHPEDQERLRRDPSLMPMAVEEVLRFYSPVTMARYVADDVEFNGCPMKKGDKVLMAFPAGNRDPEMFERPDEFVIDRERNRHFAFGSGIHRCLGSNLARMELRVAIETFLARVPPFELVDPAAVAWTGGQVRGPRRLPVRW